MRRYGVGLLCVLVLLLPQSLPGQQSSSTIARVSPDEPPALVPPEVAELEIALGRLRLVSDRFRIIRKHEQWPLAPSAQAVSDNTVAGSWTSHGQRSYQVSVAEGRPALRLSYADAHEQWTLHIDDRIGAQWSGQFRLGEQNVLIEYAQPPYQPITIQLRINHDPPQTLQAMTLWHLTEQGSPEFHQYALPSLERLNPTWNLPAALAAAKRMRDCSPLAAQVGEHQLAEYLADLDSGDHRVRDQAKQKMRAAGLAAQIPLVKLRQGRLSPQQLSTVNELLAGLEPRTADTPTRIAYWLAGDPSWR